MPKITNGLTGEQIDMEEFIRQRDEIERLKEEIAILKKSLLDEKSEHLRIEDLLKKKVVEYAEESREKTRSESMRMVDLLEKMLKL